MILNKGIKVNMNSIPYRNAMSQFVLWMDKTYPHITGELTVTCGNNGDPLFRLYADAKLSPQDKVLIRKKWHDVRTAQLKMDRLAQAISYIEGGYIVDAITTLVDYLNNKYVQAEVKGRPGYVDVMNEGENF